MVFCFIFVGDTCAGCNRNSLRYSFYQPYRAIIVPCSRYQFLCFKGNHCPLVTWIFALNSLPYQSLYGSSWPCSHRVTLPESIWHSGFSGNGIPRMASSLILLTTQPSTTILSFLLTESPRILGAETHLFSLSVTFL